MEEGMCVKILRVVTCSFSIFFPQNKVDLSLYTRIYFLSSVADIICTKIWHNVAKYGIVQRALKIV
jgi:hypothetical protein